MLCSRCMLLILSSFLQSWDAAEKMRDRDGAQVDEYALEVRDSLHIQMHQLIPCHSNDRVIGTTLSVFSLLTRTASSYNSTG